MKKIVVLILMTSFLGCTDSSDTPNIELIQDMMRSPAVKAQDEDPSRPGMLAMRLPPEGTIPRNREYYRYGLDVITAEKELVNPIQGQLSPEILGGGRKTYEIYCSVCHGLKGLGDGPVAPKMILKPPSLVSDKVKNFKDGRLYHIIVRGQGVMGNYANQIIDPGERWALINYIRSLQKLAN